MPVDLKPAVAWTATNRANARHTSNTKAAVAATAKGL